MEVSWRSFVTPKWSYGGGLEMSISNQSLKLYFGDENKSSQAPFIVSKRRPQIKSPSRPIFVFPKNVRITFN